MQPPRQTQPRPRVAMVCRRHGLILPPPQQAVLLSPTWSRGTPPLFGDDSPVTLVMALADEPQPAHDAMILAHARALRDLALLAKERMADLSPLSSRESRSLGYNLVLFGGELASAIFNAPYALAVAPDVRRQAVDIVTFATLWGAACLNEVITDHLQTLD